MSLPATLARSPPCAFVPVDLSHCAIYTRKMRPRLHSTSSPLLPFDDPAESPSDAPPDHRSPTAFISYSHETPEHDERVLHLANTLITQGVPCEIDRYQFSPPEGWPRWMQKQVQESAFVIAVCTAVYERRFTGEETNGKGKGATWEGRSIYQLLYDAVENRRVIPVVFSHADVAHIPFVLKSATYYDLSKEEGYFALHRALTNQPRFQRPPLGPIPRRLPDLDPLESNVTALLRLCPEPLPIEIVARVVGQQAKVLATTLNRLVRTAVLEVGHETVRLNDRSADGIAAPSHDLVGVALEAALDFVLNHRNATRRKQMINVVALMKAADIHTTSAQVSRTFRSIQSWLKSSGDKRLVLEVARRSVEASRVSGHGAEQVRGRQQVEDEAVAAICGVSWVYQRTGRLSEALAEAKRSLALGQALRPPWDRNTAFCYKCLGRLKRMESEIARDAHHRIELLKDSVELLLKAIDEFGKLGMEAEVGDCYSLLARTYLVIGDRGAARDAVREAEERLLDLTNKDYLDLRIVKGDLMLHINRRNAESIYTEILPEDRIKGNALPTREGVDDAQKSEIIARAYLQRGRVRATLGDGANAQADFEEAAKIWVGLEDPAADLAYWEIEGNAPWMDRDSRLVLMREPDGVRVRAARIIVAEAAGRPVGRSHRMKLPRTYLDDVISRARERLVRDQPAW